MSLLAFITRSLFVRSFVHLFICLFIAACENDDSNDDADDDEYINQTKQNKTDNK
jgi:hypothetical protein